MFWWIASFLLLAIATIFIGPRKVAAVSPTRALAAGHAKTEWKKAKDKFLTEVKKLSQSPSLTEQEKEIIRNIQKSWSGYDISFQKYVLASTKQGFWILSMWLGVLTALVALLATMLVTSWKRDPSPRSRTQVAVPIGSLDDLVKQAEALQLALVEIKTLMAQVEKVPATASQAEPEPVSEKATD